MAVGASAQDAPQQANAGFVKLDTSKDGFLSPAEVSKNKVLRNNFKKADLNHDGKLDEDEYIKGIATYQRAQAKEYAGDSTITTKVKAALLATKDLPSARISVATANGMVTLTGSLDSKEDVAKAVKAAKAVRGVKSVQNNLQAP